VLEFGGGDHLLIEVLGGKWLRVGGRQLPSSTQADRYCQAVVAALGQRRLEELARRVDDAVEHAEACSPGRGGPGELPESSESAGSGSARSWRRCLYHVLCWSQERSVPGGSEGPACRDVSGVQGGPTGVADSPTCLSPEQVAGMIGIASRSSSGRGGPGELLESSQGRSGPGGSEGPACREVSGFQGGPTGLTGGARISARELIGDRWVVQLSVPPETDDCLPGYEEIQQSNESNRVLSGLVGPRRIRGGLLDEDTHG
jgi:hypothetical protein